MGGKRKLPVDTMALPLPERKAIWKERDARSYMEGKWVTDADGAYFVTSEGSDIAFDQRDYSLVVTLCERYLREFPYIKNRNIEHAMVRRWLGESFIALGKAEAGTVELRLTLKAYDTKPNLKPIVGATIVFRSLLFAAFQRDAEDKVEPCVLDLAAEVSVKGRPPGLPPLNFDSVENYGQLRDLLSR
jgi:hypothetical protein